MYLTPDRFKTMRTGAKTTGIPDIELAEVIADASAVVDAYCNVPLLPQPHSFLGGTVIGETHLWQYPEWALDRGQRRVYLYHSPIREITSFTLFVSADASTSIPTAQFYVNKAEKWIEVTSLAIAASSGLFGVTGWVVPLGGLGNPQATINYTYGDLITETDELAYAVDTSNLTFQASHGFWQVDGDHPVTVTVDGSPATPASQDPETGRVTFGSAQTGRVRISYTHKMSRDIPSATAHIAAALLGASKHQSMLAGGVSQIRVGEIMIQRHAPAKEIAGYLDQAVPQAALLLQGHKFFWMA